MSKWLRVLAVAIAAHGIVFAITGATAANASGPEFLGWIYLFLILMPAMILAAPFSWLLWHLHLMETPGWFAWPKPAGYGLVYATWVVVLMALSLALRRH